MRYDINDSYQQEKMLKHCPQTIWGDERIMRLYIQAVDAYARFNTHCTLEKESKLTTAADAHRQMWQYYLGKVKGIVVALEVMVGNEDALDLDWQPHGDINDGITEDGHELYVEQWQWGTFNGGV